ncbi:MAG: NAD(P)/FAD-dependent oxidoreductase [Eubacterium sp.]|nr:NAD(P)/FAD-dependent oxidoreductase [Eubacterium sp.]
MKKIAVIGAGASGLMCGVFAARAGHNVVVFERNEKAGKKIYITGKGRCNLTNASDPQEILDKVVSNPRFLYSAIYSFDAYLTMDFFEKLGLEIKTERGNRVFPVSDHASDVTSVLERELKRLGVDVRYRTRVNGLLREDGRCSGVSYSVREGATETEKFDAVVICTGGRSYPSTGSTGDGYALAASAGHRIIPQRPSLVSFTTEPGEGELPAGLGLKNVSLKVTQSGRDIYNGFGEMLFTHKGVSGPLVLSASAFLGDDFSDVRACIDLKSALDEDALDRRILRDFEKNANKDFVNAIDELYPKNLIDLIVAKSGISPRKKVHDITKEERRRLVEVTKVFELRVTGTGGFEEAVITRGGVDVKEVDPSTMQSRILPGLYFAGEVLDLDALTGGFNLQIAWSTGALAGNSVCNEFDFE